MGDGYDEVCWDEMVWNEMKWNDDMENGNRIKYSIYNVRNLGEFAEMRKIWYI